MADTDPIYLDGSGPYHRHTGFPWIHHSTDTDRCAYHDSPAIPVHVFDADALAQHDAAVLAAASPGEGPPPLYVEGDWEWAVGVPAEPGDDPGIRVLAGLDKAGVFHAYASVERIVRECYAVMGGAD